MYLTVEGVTLGTSLVLVTVADTGGYCVMSAHNEIQNLCKKQSVQSTCDSLYLPVGGLARLKAGLDAAYISAT